MEKIILEQIANRGIKFKLLPIECLTYIKSDILRFSKIGNLNGFQKWIINERYILDVPELTFKPKTIIVAAIKFKLVNIIFNFGGKSITDIFCVARKGVKDFMSTLFLQSGYNIQYVHWLPQKRLAVCSGLAEYGRNNITYIDGWGSFFELQTYITDMPCEQNYILRDICCMDICDKCNACMTNCPTAAIRNNRFLIDNEICLSYLNELEDPFPNWLLKSAHHSVYGCYKCQDICSKNKTILSNITETESFSQEETECLLNGVKRDDIPKNLLNKLERLGVDDWRLRTMPKNLKALIDNVN